MMSQDLPWIKNPRPLSGRLLLAHDQEARGGGEGVMMTNKVVTRYGLGRQVGYNKHGLIIRGVEN